MRLRLLWIIISAVGWRGVSTQCKDPMIFKLTYIAEVIANLTTRLEEQEAVIEKQVGRAEHAVKHLIFARP